MRPDENNRALDEILENLKEVKKDLEKSKDLQAETKRSIDRAQEQIERLRPRR